MPCFGYSGQVSPCRGCQNQPALVVGRDGGEKDQFPCPERETCKRLLDWQIMYAQVDPEISDEEREEREAAEKARIAERGNLARYEAVCAMALPLFAQKMIPREVVAHLGDDDVDQKELMRWMGILHPGKAYLYKTRMAEMWKTRADEFAIDIVAGNSMQHTMRRIGVRVTQKRVKALIKKHHPDLLPLMRTTKKP